MASEARAISECERNSFAIASPHLGTKAIGFMYADNGVSLQPIGPE